MSVRTWHKPDMRKNVCRNEDIMTIKEVSQKYNISSDTLRYYERVGMIPPVTRTAGGIRDSASLILAG